MTTTTLTFSGPMAPGRAFDTVTTALAGLYDTAAERGEAAVVEATGRVLVAMYELLRDGEVGDRVQCLGAALAACGRRQPTLLARRGLRVDLTPEAASTLASRYHNAALLLHLAATGGRLRCCATAERERTVLVPSCRHAVCTVATQLSRHNA